MVSGVLGEGETGGLLDPVPMAQAVRGLNGANVGEGIGSSRLATGRRAERANTNLLIEVLGLGGAVPRGEEKRAAGVARAGAVTASGVNAVVLADDGSAVVVVAQVQLKGQAEDVAEVVLNSGALVGVKAPAGHGNVGVARHVGIGGNVGHSVDVLIEGPRGRDFDETEIVGDDARTVVGVSIDAARRPLLPGRLVVGVAGVDPATLGAVRAMAGREDPVLVDDGAGAVPAEEGALHGQEAHEVGLIRGRVDHGAADDAVIVVGGLAVGHGSKEDDGDDEQRLHLTRFECEIRMRIDGKGGGFLCLVISFVSTPPR